MKETIKSLTVVLMVVFIAFSLVSGVSYFAWKKALQERTAALEEKISEETISFNPDIDIVDEGENYTVDVDLPGLNKGSIEVKFVNGELIVCGNRLMNNKKTSEAIFLRRECAHGRFARRIAVPQDVDYAGISAEYGQGVLSMILPKGRTQEHKKEVDTTIIIK